MREREEEEEKWGEELGRGGRGVEKGRKRGEDGEQGGRAGY